MTTQQQKYVIYAKPCTWNEEGFYLCLSNSTDYVTDPILMEGNIPVVIPENISELLHNSKLIALEKEQTEILADLERIEEKIKNMLALPAPFQEQAL